VKTSSVKKKRNILQDCLKGNLEGGGDYQGA